MKKVMVTGGAGFIGVNLVRMLLRERPEWEIVNYDLLTYAGNLRSLSDLEHHPRYQFVRGDVADPKVVAEAMQGCWGVMHLAAESHVDRSILDASPFIRTNVTGTQVMLDVARQLGVERFLLVSTDEVYGSLKPDDHAFTEENQLRPNSPYSASKAGADLLARAYFKTYDFPVINTRCSNNYGPYQFPEKLIPLLIANAMKDKPIPVYGDGMQVRDWIFVDDHCRGLIDCLERGQIGEVYNLGGLYELPNLTLIKTVLKALNKPESLITFVKDRPGHDRRYAMDCTRIGRELGWKPAFDFEQAIEKTIAWYLDNLAWVEEVTSGAYRDYYETQYGKR
jgi:dTDP-glucose 4,6-dehydratase